MQVVINWLEGLEVVLMLVLDLLILATYYRLGRKLSKKDKSIVTNAFLREARSTDSNMAREDAMRRHTAYRDMAN